MPTNASPLDQLIDIHLPNSVSWWPLAPGWWALMGLFILTLIIALRVLKHKKRNSYRETAKAQLEEAYANLQSTPAATAQYLQAVNIILKRTALTAQSKTFSAAIKGEEWLNWLDSIYPSATKSPQQNSDANNFSQGVGRVLLIGLYQKSPDIDADRLHKLCLDWLATHKNQWQKNKSLATRAVIQEEAKNV